MQMRQNKMGIMPVPRLLLSMAIPLMLSLLVQSLYNIVDSMYVSRISEKALTATSLAYPVQMLMIALGVGTAVGINALLSRLLGEKKPDQVTQGAVTGLVLAVFSSMVFILSGLLFSARIAHALTPEPETARMCAAYLRIVTVFSTGSFVETMTQRFLQASGRTGLSMVSLIVGAVTNLILDPVFIFTFHMGVEGAAIATVIGQWLGALTAIVLNHCLNPEVRISFHGFRLQRSVVRAIYKVGFPTILMQAMGSIMNFGMNAILGSGTAVAFFGVYFRLQSFLFMPMNGLGQACLPVIGYNLGARRPERIRATVKTAVSWGIGIGLAGTALFMAAPGWLLSLFQAGEDMLVMGVPALRILCVPYALTAVTTVLGMCASGLGNGVINMAGTGIRQVVLLLPCFALMKTGLGLDRAWYAVWMAEICAAVLVILFTRRELKRAMNMQAE